MTMVELATHDVYGVLTEPATLTIRRLLPGPIERVWAYLTESDFAPPVACGWPHGDEGRHAVRTGLAQRRADRPAGTSGRPDSRGEPDAEPDRRVRSAAQARLRVQGSGDVSFELEPKGDEVLLTLTHRRLPDRAMLVKVASGWHMHLDLLVARASAPRRRRSGTGGIACARITSGGSRPDISREADMRKLIAATKISIDGKMEGLDGTADWVEAWSDDYGLLLTWTRCLTRRRDVSRLRAVLDGDPQRA
jgi:uncharacterized protein YndB with AHSA1/START domain